MLERVAVTATVLDFKHFGVLDRDCKGLIAVLCGAFISHTAMNRNDPNFWELQT